VVPVRLPRAHRRAGGDRRVDSAEVEIVWDEAWTTDRLSDSAVAKLRFLPDPTAVPDRDAYIATHRTKIEEAS
jgi:metal-sulfur cluster biosynthetic enzyme